MDIQFIHTVPIGDSEPIHYVTNECWCQPLETNNLVTHHAKDCREAMERQGIKDPLKPWATVCEIRRKLP